MIQAQPSSNIDWNEAEPPRLPDPFAMTRSPKPALGRVGLPNGQSSEALRDYADRLWYAGERAAADAAYARYIEAAVDNPVLIQAAGALLDSRLAVAERLLKDFLKRHPTDIVAIRMLAELATRIGRYGDAENLLSRCLELAPSFEAARHNYAVALYRQNKAVEAVAQIDHLLKIAPKDPNYRSLKAAALGQLGEYSQAIELYAAVLKEHPNQPKAWMSYGHALKTEGRREESVAAYRRAIQGAPNLGEAYWSLANLKTFEFGPADLAAMSGQLARTDLNDDDRLHFHFALAKGLEDGGDYQAAFQHYAEGNRLRRGQIVYDADQTSTQRQRSIAFFDVARFAAVAGSGCPSPDPIFIVGLPRSGSTLIEQILSSHSAVEGTMELPDIPSIARELGGQKKRGDETRYPEILATLPPDGLRQLGEDYLRRTRIQRKTGRPFFIDKMPHNFLHIGLIQSILPNAKIIDARRHPLGACFSAFKQHFARGQTFCYDLTELGRYYRDYVALMAHFDEVLPGRVHRVYYEAMVGDTEAETRKLLDYCGLPFEEGCLRFYENTRAVRTASSEQVRRPIFSDGVDHWRHFEPWLSPLKAALGPALEEYPQFSGPAVASARASVGDG
jgi:tetratricopeptide (TPR) repeat protein